MKGGSAMAERLLVPLDGSELSEVALPWAASLARGHGFSLVLVRVVPWPLWMGQPDGYMTPDVYEHVRATELDEATTYLAAVRQRLVARNLVVETVVAEGFPATAILDLAEERDAVAIVMATHGRGGVARLVLGSVATQMVAQATMPLLLVRPEPSVPAATPTLRRLLVPLDGSPLAEQALDLAQAVASEGATLLLLRVVAPVERRKPGVGVPDTFIDEVATQGAVREAASYLRQLAESRVRPPCAVETLVRVGHPTEQIFAAAQEASADLIVASTHGRTGPRRWLLGSVADGLVRRAEVPVFLVSARVLAARVASPYRVQDLMTRELITVQAGEPLVMVLRKLLRRRVSGAPVVNADGQLVGVISEHDLLAWQVRTLDELRKAEQLDPREYARRLETTPAREVMVHPPVTIAESAPLMDAVRLFVGQQCRRLPVTRDGKLVGMLSRADVLSALAAQWEAIAAHPAAEEPSTVPPSSLAAREAPAL
jgi:nucleotide-binding universal stress UspA family protein/predicted transcriptional regulator